MRCSGPSSRSTGNSHEALSKLEDAELASCRGEPPESIYSFRHALVQDTAYSSLLKSRRQQLHRQIAEALRDRFHRSRTQSLRSSLITSPRPISPSRPSNGGPKLESKRSIAVLMSRRYRTTRRRSAWPRNWATVPRHCDGGYVCRSPAGKRSFRRAGMALLRPQQPSPAPVNSRPRSMTLPNASQSITDSGPGATCAVSMRR